MMQETDADRSPVVGDGLLLVADPPDRVGQETSEAIRPSERPIGSMIGCSGGSSPARPAIWVSDRPRLEKSWTRVRLLLEVDGWWATGSRRGHRSGSGHVGALFARTGADLSRCEPLGWGTLVPGRSSEPTWRDGSRSRPSSTLAAMPRPMVWVEDALARLVKADDESGYRVDRLLEALTSDER